MTSKKTKEKATSKKAKPQSEKNDSETNPEEEKNVGGRPRKEVDLNNLEALCEMQCTEVEIASFFNCSVDTLTRRIQEKYEMTFAEFYKLKSGKGRISMRRAFWKEVLGQIEIIEDGEKRQENKDPNATLLLHAMKTLGGLNEKTIHEHQGKDGGAIKFANKTDDELKDDVKNLLRLVEEANKK